MRDKSKILFAKGLRGDMSPPEVFLWMRLKSRRHGLMFRRQHPIGAYVLDFYCVQVKLAVEVDGEHHFYEEQQRKDAVRDAWLAGQGIETKRIPADEIIADSDEAAELVWAKAAAIMGRRQPPPSLRATSPASQGRRRPRLKKIPAPKRGPGGSTL